jgi:hypothetical protein
MRFLCIGNCQVSAYHNCLLENNYDSTKLTTYIDDISTEKLNVTLNNYDFCIHQSNKNISYEKLQRNHELCKFILVPSLMFFLYFPDVDKTFSFSDEDPNAKYPHGYISYKHCLLNDSIEDISKTQIWNEFSKMFGNISSYCNLLLSKDKEYGISIYSYILNNFRIRRLFHSFNHPSNELLNMVMTHIKDKLGLTISINMFDEIHDEIFGFYKDVIYRATKDIFDLQFPLEIQLHRETVSHTEFALRYNKWFDSH